METVDSPTVEIQPSCLPPVNFVRNDFGLLTHINYVFDDSGLVNWRAMIPKEYLVPNKQNFEKRGEPVPTSVEGLDDKNVLILLAGIKYLAMLRGFYSVKYTAINSSPSHCTVVCSIDWIGNYETTGNPVVFSGVGDATPLNTSEFGQYYLGPIAENRAFVRTVRNFLRINIVGADEVNNMPVTEEIPNPNANGRSSAVLESICSEKGLSFKEIKDRLIKENIKDAKDFEVFSDIPANIAIELIDRLKKFKGKKSST